MAKVDLHNHSNYSPDGEFTPEELVSTAKAVGIATLALTDHNTTRGVKAAVAWGKQAGVEVIPGIEIDCVFDGCDFHLLGYGIDPDYPALCQLEEGIKAQEKGLIPEKVKIFNSLGIPITLEEGYRYAKDGAYLIGEIVAELALSRADSSQNPLLLPYLPGGERSDNPYVNFYKDYCAQGKPAYKKVEYIPMEQAIEMICASGGVPVLAHPGHNLKGRLEMLPALVQLGVEGLEGYSSYHTPEENAYFVGKAQEHGLLFTGGSDYHGKTKPSVKMGQYGMAEDGAQMLEGLQKAIHARK